MYMLILGVTLESVILYLKTTGLGLEGESQDGMKCTFSEMFTSLVRCNQKSGVVIVMPYEWKLYAS
jgi:hypothetical protein